VLGFICFQYMIKNTEIREEADVKLDDSRKFNVIEAMGNFVKNRPAVGATLAAMGMFVGMQGANSSADVYLDGKKLAHHDGGYSTWRVDLTDGLKDESLLAVAVDNTPNETVYPQMADFTFYGGIYRDVNIVCVSESHFDLDYYSGPGFAVTPEITGKDAKVTVETWMTNMKPGQVIRYTVTSRCGARPGRRSPPIPRPCWRSRMCT